MNFTTTSRIRRFAMGLSVLALGFVPAAGAMAQLASPPGGGNGAASVASGGPSGFTPTTDMVENGGIGVRVLFLGRNPDGKHLTVSAEIRNVADEPAFIALVGPAPSAIDNMGVTYELKQISGLATCEKMAMNWIQNCMNNYGNSLPGGVFSQLQPGASSVVAMTFEAPEITKTGFLSLALNVALAMAKRPDSAHNKERGLDNIAISFPIIQLTE
jgi:hypothetical protein